MAAFWGFASSSGGLGLKLQGQAVGKDWYTDMYGCTPVRFGVLRPADEARQRDLQLRGRVLGIRACWKHAIQQLRNPVETVCAFWGLACNSGATATGPEAARRGFRHLGLKLQGQAVGKDWYGYVWLHTCGDPGRRPA